MSTHRSARYVTVNEAEVQKLRKTWLTLQKNVKRVRSLQDIKKLTEATNRWGRDLNELWEQIRDDLKGRKRDPNSKANADWIEQYLNSMSLLWELSYEVRNIPSVQGFKFKDTEATKRNLMKDGFMTPEEADAWIARNVPSEAEQEKAEVEKWKEKARLWAQRGRRKALLAWKWLKDFAQWTVRTDWYGGGGEATEWSIREEERQTLEGFQTIIIGFDERQSFHWEQLERLRAGLRRYRGLAKKRFPWLLQYQLPFKIYFSGGPGHRNDAAATYERDHIAMGAFSMADNNPRALVKIIAHEMGHHIWRTFLSGEERELWHKVIKGDFGDLDLRKVLSRMKPNETIYEFEDRIERTDPILALQIEGMYHDRKYKDLRLLGVSDIRDALNSGKSPPVVKVPKNPITGYATKNTEEAFCDTLGLLVGFGPRTLTAEIRNLFKIVMPRVKMSSLRVARRHFASQATVQWLEKVYDALVNDPTGWRDASPAGKLIKREIRDLTNEWSGRQSGPVSVSEFIQFLRDRGIDDEEIAIVKSVRAPRSRKKRKPTRTLGDAYSDFSSAVGISTGLINYEYESTDPILVSWVDAWRKAIVSLKGKQAQWFKKLVPKLWLRAGSRGTENASWEPKGMILVLKTKEKPSSVSTLRHFLVHETGHAFQWKNHFRPGMPGTGYGEPPYVSAYAGTNADEDFAETFRAFLMEPQTLKRLAPAKYRDMASRL